jgi:hypothetical protein
MEKILYLVLSAEVTGVLIGQSEAEVSEDVGEDQEHLTFIDQFHFPSIEISALLSLCYHLHIFVVFYYTFMTLKGC